MERYYLSRCGYKHVAPPEQRLTTLRVVCTVASVVTLPSPPGPKETWLRRGRSAATCDSDLRCRYSLEAISLDHSNRVGTGSYSPPLIAGCSDTAASNPNPPRAFAGAFLSPYRCHEQCIGCKR